MNPPRLQEPAVTLADVLAARDSRVERQAALLDRLGPPLLSVTLVSPGPVKDSPERRALMERAEAALASMLAEAGMEVLHCERVDGVTGPELMLAVKGDALALKRLAVRLEEREPQEPWGRLIDADVICGFFGTEAGRVPLSVKREEIGEPRRRCLVCDQEAAECMALRRHGVAELAAAAERLFGGEG